MRHAYGEFFYKKAGNPETVMGAKKRMAFFVHSFPDCHSFFFVVRYIDLIFPNMLIRFSSPPFRARVGVIYEIMALFGTSMGIVLRSLDFFYFFSEPIVLS